MCIDKLPRAAIGKRHMKEINQEQIQYLRQVLDERADALRADLQREAEGKENYLDIANEISEPGMASFASLAVDVGHAEITRDINELKAIDKARERIEDGSYGECIECLTAIPFERLKVQPTAVRCAPCQEMYEKTHANTAQGPTM